MNRRQFVSSSSAVIASSVALPVLTCVAEAQTKQPAWVAKLSPAVANAVVAAAAPFKSGARLTELEFQAFEQALTTWFGNLQEVGAYPDMLAAVENSGFLSTPPDEQQLATLRQKLSAAGWVNISTEEFNGFAASIPESIVNLRSILESGGIAAVHSLYLDSAAALAEQAWIIPPPPPGVTPALNKVLPYGVCGGITAAGAYLSIWGAMGVSGILVAGIFTAPIMAWVGVGLAIGGILCY